MLRAILDAANECLGHFDDRPAAERWCDTLFHLLDLAAFAAELGGPAPGDLHGSQCVRNKCDKEGPRKSARLVLKACLQD